MLPVLIVVFVPLRVLVEDRDRDERLPETLFVDSNFTGGGRSFREPNVSPNSILSAPLRRGLSLINPGPLRNQAKTVDASLNLHLSGFLIFDEIDLSEDWIEPGPATLLDEQLQLVIGCSLANRSLDEVDFLGVELDGLIWICND
jgi:hypothetical protein